MKWVVVCSRSTRNFVLGAHHCDGGPVCPVSERRTTGCVGESWCSGAASPSQRAGAVSPGSGSSARASRIMSRSAMMGTQRGGLYEQAPRAAAPILSFDFPRVGWRRHGGSAPAGYCERAENPRSRADSLPGAPMSHQIHTRSWRKRANKRNKGRHQADTLLFNSSVSAPRRNFQ